MRVVIAGSRDYRDRIRMILTLDEIEDDYGFDLVIHGGQEGADALAEDWALSRGISVDPYPPDWKHFGQAAGPFRNRKMILVAQPELVIVFPLTVLAASTWTKDLVAQANWANIETIVIEGA